MIEWPCKVPTMLFSFGEYGSHLDQCDYIDLQSCTAYLERKQVETCHNAVIAIQCGSMGCEFMAVTH